MMKTRNFSANHSNKAIRKEQKGLKALAFILMLTLVFSLFTTSALADCGDNATYQTEVQIDTKIVFEEEEVEMDLDDSGSVIGATSLTEQLEMLGYQHAGVSSPSGAEPNGFIRRKAWSMVMVQNGEFTCGVSKITIKSLCLYPEYAEIVKGIVMSYVPILKGIPADEVEFNAKNIFAATLYMKSLCEVNRMTTHMFFTSQMNRTPVGVVTFQNNRSVLLYMGDWDGDGRLDLGFAAGRRTSNQRVEVEEEEESGFETVTVTYIREYGRTKITTRTYRDGVLVDEEVTYEYDYQTDWTPIQTVPGYPTNP